ncbi:hypothetical protein HY486_03295 [Candidatus Woesearchaeota archaeon]|nr:hypothetical protein [Candidatus Woesearchaeota archaeon]
MKLEYAFLSVVVIAIAGLVLTWIAPGGTAGVVNIVKPCFDSDGENDEFVQGYIQTATFFDDDHCEFEGERIDSCRGRYCRIAEYSCVVGRPSVVKKPCPTYAPLCQKGTCVSPADIKETFFEYRR